MIMSSITALCNININLKVIETNGKSASRKFAARILIESLETRITAAAGHA